MTELITFLVVVLAGLFFSDLFRRLHLPYVVALIIGGILIGPFGFRVFEPNDTIEFLAEIGLIFLMFMAGLEIKLKTFNEMKGSVMPAAILNGSIPFLVGIGIAFYLGYNEFAALLIGTIFISSSIAVVVPALQANKLFQTNVGKTILGATILEDIVSLVLLSLVIQLTNPTSSIPLPFFYAILIIYLVLLRSFIPKIKRAIFPKKLRKHDLFEEELQLIIAILIGTVVFLDILGVHAIVAGFFSGLILSDSIKSKRVKEKLHAISYGLFIPVFFILVGSQANVGILFNASDALLVTALIIVGAAGSKFLSGFLAGKVVKFNNTQSALLGASTIPQLSTTLAVAFLGLEFGLLDEKLIIAITALSIITTLIGPFLVSLFAGKMRDENIQQTKS